MVYLTQEDWNKFFLPKLFEDNNSFDNELKFFKNIYNIMTFINSKIKNSKQIILSTSMIYFHKYYIQNLINYKNLTPLDKLIISVIRVSVIVNIIMDIIKNKLQNINFEHEKIKEMIFEKEFEILKSMEFCLNVELPYKFILVLKNYFENNTNISSEILIKSCCQYINDLIFFPISLYYTPNTIAISCVKLIKEKYNLVDINLNDVISLSEYKIDLKELNECFLIIQKLFDKL